ncbi:histidine-rich glycoprotein-like [Penaeus monodon]|uniref:histidine-rich glycoprotein-like n=1 Tax=Penaeus monodon TaxID=6687 RepID=UPI0018A7A579|nr:histidine-rich glycoprotein-like [Penaeus monodon]
MIRGVILVAACLAAVAALPIELIENRMAYVMDNMTAIWREIAEIRQDINLHLHGGHQEQNHDKIVKEVEMLLHEHETHHLHHQHQGHEDHHNEELLQHLEDTHGHGHEDDHHDDHLHHKHHDHHEHHHHDHHDDHDHPFGDPPP